ncbi:MAG: lysozyme inhibitor LprI family protein [Aestuariivirga sp.]
MAFSEDVAATLSDEEIATKDAATVKTCLDVVDAKIEEENALRQTGTENAAAANVAPDVTTDKKTGPEAYLEASAQSRPRFASENCIGIVADACLATDDGQTTLGMMECFGREQSVWDARLNSSYREQTAASLKKPEDAAVAKHLRKVQAAWIPWRDATCEVIYANGIPLYGSDSKVDSVYCDMVLTARQSLSVEGKMIMSFDAPTGQ